MGKGHLFQLELCQQPWLETHASQVTRKLHGTVASRNKVRFVTLTKNPYSWLLSLHKRPYHGDRKAPQQDFEAFLRKEYCPKGRDNVGKANVNHTLLWNHKNRSYLELATSFSGINVRYEDLLDDPASTLAAICQAWDLEFDRNQFQNYSDSTKDSDKDANFYRDYYLGEVWRSKLSREAIAIINRDVDFELMQHYGYQQLV